MQPQKSISTSLIGASGDCLLAFTPQKQIVCALLPSRQKVGVWPYDSLRTYWGGKDTFGFKSGRRSPRGEGEFVFFTGRGEEIYRYLTRTVRLTSMAAAAAKSSEGELLDSLPPDPTRSETPVPSSDSDEGENHQPSPPHVPPKPPDLSKRLSMGSLPLPQIPTATHAATPTPSGSRAGTVVSDTSPAYSVNRSSKYRTAPKERIRMEASRRSQSMGAVLPLESHASVVGPSHSLPLANRPLPEGEDDTYSHATHDLPQKFVRNVSVKLVEGPALYHGLVRTESTRSTVAKPASRPPGGGMADANPDELVYDLAYPPDAGMVAQVRVPVNEGEYGSMGDAEQQRRELVEKRLVQPSGDGGHALGKEGKTVSGGGGGGNVPGQGVMSVSGGSTSGQGGKVMSRGSKPIGVQLRTRVEGIDGGRVPSLERRGDDEGLTDNPMYDSTENMLSPTFLGVTGGAVGGAVGGAAGGRGRDGRHYEGKFALDMTDSMILNPVYGHAPKIASKGGASGGASSAQSGTVSKVESPLEHSMAPNPLYGTGPVLQMGESSKQPPVGDATTESSQGSRETGRDQNPVNSKENTDIKAPEDGGEVCKPSRDGGCGQGDGGGCGQGEGGCGQGDGGCGQGVGGCGQGDGGCGQGDGGCSQGEDTQQKSQDRGKRGSVETSTQSHCPTAMSAGESVAGESVAGDKQENSNSSNESKIGVRPTEDKEEKSDDDKPSTDHMADKPKEGTDIGVSGGGGDPQEGHTLGVDAAKGRGPQKDDTLDVRSDSTVEKKSPKKGEKGYTKVDKNRREKSGERDTRSGDESPPPPLPPRKYTNGSDS